MTTTHLVMASIMYIAIVALLTFAFLHCMERIKPALINWQFVSGVVALVILINATAWLVGNRSVLAQPRTVIYHLDDVTNITIMRHTYDGLQVINGRWLDFTYGAPGGIYIEMVDGGDGIFHNDFEE